MLRLRLRVEQRAFDVTPDGGFIGVVVERRIDEDAGGAHGLAGTAKLRRHVGAFVRVD